MVMGFCQTKLLLDMKKIIFVLPLTALFAYCSSSKRIATPPAGPGVSNVTVYNGGDTAKASTAKYNTTNSVKDFGYRASTDTTLNGSWTLEGMVAADGSWSQTQAWYPQDTALSATTVDSTQTQTSMSAAADKKALHKKAMAWKKDDKNAKPATGQTAKTGDQSFSAGLNGSTSATTMTDTATAQPEGFRYWQRIPQITFKPTAKVFTGNTGCNTMSGSFNFGGNDLQFNKRIATSKMACNEYNETAFLDAMKKVDNYTINGDRLELRQGSTLLLAFNRKS
ncbi:MAG: protein of unknown function Meta and HslJ [Segetibacter sp.]|nr:protein of unknown function Meta and HslJ [Segetibacter sp.]